MAAEKKSKFLVHILDDDARDQLKSYFRNLEDELGREGMGTALFNVVQELVTNAVKANVKRVFFEQNHYNLEDPAGYKKGLEDFRTFFRSLDAASYQKTLKEMELSVRVDVDLDHQRLLIYVRNNTIMIQQEEVRIRKNLAAAMGVKDLVEFSVHYGDESEGNGLGLAMVVLLIKDMGFDPGFFRVYHNEGHTTARLEFPLSADYRPLRKVAN
ncbi:MAG: hypothetical protein CMN77_16290 [Spirochaetaceae bacterium]|nr:hypothetical protein [Spirochaetaceae bacterium]|tara:strand:- start:17657 stop:18295 length:639 start_codon:yes stop_codon:yes gene_type:complete